MLEALKKCLNEWYELNWLNQLNEFECPNNNCHMTIFENHLFCLRKPRRANRVSGVSRVSNKMDDKDDKREFHNLRNLEDEQSKRFEQNGK